MPIQVPPTGGLGPIVTPGGPAPPLPPGVAPQPSANVLPWPPGYQPTREEIAALLAQRGARVDTGTLAAIVSNRRAAESAGMPSADAGPLELSPLNSPELQKRIENPAKAEGADETTPSQEADPSAGASAGTFDPGRSARLVGAGGGMKPIAPPFDQIEAGVARANAAQQGVVDEAARAKDTRDAATQGMFGVTDAYARDIGDAEDMRQIYANKVAADVAELQKRNEALAQEARNTRIDENAFWHEPGTQKTDVAKKWGMAIAVALGELGSKMPHTGGSGVNGALQIMNGAIERNIEAQKSNLQNKWKAVAEGSDLIKDKFAEAAFKSDQTDRLKLTLLEKMKAKATALAESTQNADAKVKLSLIAADAQEKIENTLKGMAMARFNWMMQQQAAASAPSAEDVAMRKAGQTAVEHAIEEAIKNGQPPPTDEQRRAIYRGAGVQHNNEPGVRGSWAGTGVSPHGNKQAEAEASRQAGIDQADLLMGEVIKASPLEDPTNVFKQRRMAQDWNNHVLDAQKNSRNPSFTKEKAAALMLDETDLYRPTIMKEKLERFKNSHLPPGPGAPKPAGPLAPGATPR